MTTYAQSVVELSVTERSRLDAEADQVFELGAAVTSAMPDISTLEGIEQARIAQEAIAGPEAENVEIIEIPGPAGPIGARVVRPSGATTGVCLDIHGGGWCLGSARQQDPIMTMLAEKIGVATIAIDYRLAPEHPFPAAIDDVGCALRWFIDNAPKLFGADRLVIQGASAGAHLAALALIGLRNSDGPEAVAQIAAANLVFGAYDLTMTPSARNADDAPVIPTRVIRDFISHFLPGLDESELRNPEISPMYADLTGLPPARFTVGDIDPLLDDSVMFTERWDAAGNHAELAVYPKSIHGFPIFPLGYAELAQIDMTGFIERAIVGELAPVP